VIMMVGKEYPILEYDPSVKAVIEPFHSVQRMDIPEHCIICFFKEVIDKIVAEREVRLVTEIGSEMGKHPVVLSFDSG